MSATITENQVVLTKKDHAILTEYVKNLHGMQVNEKENFRKLSIELAKAKVIDGEDLSEDIVRIDSIVVIKDVETKKEMKITIVLPPLADIKQRKISVLAPIGTALIGFRKGQEVSWEVPAGKKTFIITEVDNGEIKDQ